MIGMPKQKDGEYYDHLGKKITYAEYMTQMGQFSDQLKAAQAAVQPPGQLQMDAGGNVIPALPVTGAVPGTTNNPYLLQNLNPEAVGVAGDLTTQIKQQQLAKQFAPAAVAGLVGTVLQDPRRTAEGRRLFGRKGEMRELEELMDQYESGAISGREFLQQQDPGTLQAIEEAQRQAQAEVDSAEREAYGRLAGATEGTSVASGIGQVAAGAAQARAQAAMQGGQMMMEGIRGAVDQSYAVLGQLRDAYGQAQAGVRMGVVKTLTQLTQLLGQYHGVQPTEYITPFTVGAMLDSYQKSGMSAEEAQQKVLETFKVAGNDKSKQLMIRAFFTDPVKDFYQSLRGGVESEALPIEYRSPIFEDIFRGTASSSNINSGQTE